MTVIIKIMLINADNCAEPTKNKEENEMIPAHL